MLKMENEEPEAGLIHHFIKQEIKYESSEDEDSNAVPNNEGVHLDIKKEKEETDLMSDHESEPVQLEDKVSDFKKEISEYIKYYYDNKAPDAYDNNIVQTQGLFCWDGASSSSDGRENSTPDGMEELKCPICNKCFITKPDLKRHIISVHCVLKTFPCNECEKSFMSRDSLNKHKQMHGGIKKFVCEICDKHYISKKRLETHVSTHVLYLNENKKQFKCRECNKQFSSKGYLSQHLEAHADLNKSRCPNCSKIFATELVLKKHIRAVHYKEKNFACNECGRAFQTRWSLSEHNKQHGGVKKYMCDLCSSFFVSKSQLRSHHWKHDNKFKCKTCGVNLSTKEDLIQHSETHAGMVTKFSCEKCNKCYDKKTVLRRHIEEVHQRRGFVCDECGDAFKSRWKLNCHKVQHTSVMKFKCQICKKSFMWKSKLKRHYLTHAKKLKTEDYGEKFCSKERPSEPLNQHTSMEQLSELLNLPKENFYCQICGENNTDLKNHMLLHKDLKNFSCAECNKDYTSKKVLIEHMTTVHIGSKNYICDVCGKSFKSNWHLNVHKTRHMGIKPFYCQICNKHLSDKSVLQRHYKRIHMKTLKPEEYEEFVSADDPSSQCVKIYTGKKINDGSSVMPNNHYKKIDTSHDTTEALPFVEVCIKEELTDVNVKDEDMDVEENFRTGTKSEDEEAPSESDE